MKRLIYIIILFSNIAFGQESMLYKNDRKLIIDSSFQIDENSFKNVNNFEKVILPRIYNGIKYPEIARENNQEGTVIVCFSISKNIKDYTFKIVKSDCKEFDQSVTDFFKSLTDFTKEQLIPEKGNLIVYVPIVFKINQKKYLETLLKNKAVTIEANDIAPQITIIKH